jgi:5-formyltetrahydrofolate cyclo-ligase
VRTLNNKSLKSVQRKSGISARKSLEKETAAAFSRIISDKLISSAYVEACTIFSYQPFGGETDISYFNEWAATNGKRIAFPICRTNGIMVAAIPKDHNAWETGKYGIKAPDEQRSLIIDPSEIELIIVPCTAFNGVSKMRIGMGAGYYDRYLPKCKKAVSIAAAFEVQQIQDLYFDELDVPLDHIVTEKYWY